MSHDETSKMNRRDFIGAAAAVSAGLIAGIPGVAAADGSKGAGLTPVAGGKKGPITLYYEFRIAQSVNWQALAEIEAEAARLYGKRDFLGLSLKQMVGESTMVRNFPASYKGLLGSAYADGASGGTLPIFYSLFLRFNGMGALHRSGVMDWFIKTIAPLLFVYRPGVGKTDIAFDYFTGLFQTVAAGDRNGVYTSQDGIVEFLRSQQDQPELGYTTVNNHVSIHDRDLAVFESKVLPLLTVAQETFQPSADDGGLAGAPDNTYYRQAVTTEILRNAYPDGQLRSYMMHGLWQSIWDHENSHLDPRFKLASTPVGAHVVAGPIEPFYATRFLQNN
jgi:hypothetical protein